MAIINFGNVLTTSNNTTEATMLSDGRIAVAIQGAPVQIYSQGTLVGTVDPYQSGAGISPNGGGGGHIAALADGGFVVTGARGTDIGFRIYNADFSERTSGTVIIATPGFFNGGHNYGHILKALPNGGFVVEWNTTEAPLSGSSSLGVTSQGVPIYEGGSGPQGSTVDVRASVYNANGALVSPSHFIVTQGAVQFPTYLVESRFGQQYISDIDVLANGDIVSTIYGQRWSPPSGGNLSATYTSGYFYDTFRVNNGATGDAITGETPYNTTASIGQNTTSTGPHQTVILSSGLIAGLYSVDTGVAGAGQYQSRLQLMNTNGTPVGGPVDLALQFGFISQNPGIVAAPTASGGFVIAYRIPPTYADANTASMYDVYLREYSGNGTVIGTQQVTNVSGFEQILNLTQGPDGLFLLTTNINFSGMASTQMIAVTGAGDAVLNGGTTAETLNATATGRQWTFSGGGADTINGGSGTNYLYGGSGDSIFNGGSGVNVIRGGTGNEIIRGGTQNDTLSGGAGNDVMAGGSGQDTMSGGSGNDQLDGGAGADYQNGDIGFDFARYDASSAGIVVRLDYNFGLGGDAQADTLINIEGLIGSGHQDYLFGDAGNNALLGQGGNDWLYGHGGTDELRGGDGTDQILGGTGGDLLYGEGGNDQFWFTAADFQAGVWDYIYGFGESGSNFDYLRFEGVSAGQLIIGDNAGNAVVTTTALNYAGGVVIFNFSGVQTLDQLQFG